MSFLELVHKRYSVRKYRNVPVEEEMLQKIFMAVSAAPSAVNYQPWVFIIIRDEHSRFSFEKVYPREWFVTAPCIIAACCNRELSWKRSDGKNFGEIDTAIALDHLTLAAAELGLGTCWVGNFNVPEARLLLKLPEHIEPVALTPLGYPEGTPPKKKRKSADAFIFTGHYGGKSGL
jgi:nitroreductase